MIVVTRGNSHCDKIRAYKIFIDGVYCGDIRNNEIKGFAVDNGSHTVCAKIDWCRSNELCVNINNSTANIEVGPTLTGSKFLIAILYITIFRNEYLWLRETGFDAGQPGNQGGLRSAGEDLYNKANELCKRRKYDEAMPLFERAREMGYKPKDKYRMLKEIYYSRAGDSKDENEMLKWCNKGIEIGDARPLAALARHYSVDYNYYAQAGKVNRQPDWDKAFYYWLRYAEAGGRKACPELGDCYFYGRGTSIDYVKAIEQYANSLNGDEKIYSLTKTAPPDFQRLAFEHLSQNRQKGEGYNFWLAECYYYGYGTEVNYEKAFRLYCDSYEKNCFYGGAIFKLDELTEMSFEFFSRKTDAQGICFFGMWHYHRKQYGKAFELFTKSAELGSWRAMCHLGEMYRYGYGVDVDYPLAFEWISKGAEKNFSGCAAALADCYEKGIGVPVDKQKAYAIRMSDR